MNLSKISKTVLEVSFYLLFFFVPIIWLPVTSELFEFNKMILTYLLTVVVLAAWLLKSLSDKRFQLTRTALDIPIALFLVANILSTIFSLDPHTSLFGYYGRWHGGLLSTISYIVLYYALVSHFDRKQILYYLATLFTSGLIVSIYAVLQHPNPIFRQVVDGKTILHGIDYDYWAVDVEDRVFSTFGQPNWLAAALAMLLLPLVSLLFILKKYWQLALVFVSVGVYYLAFTFTYSRGGLIGLLVGALTFVVLFPVYKPTLFERIKAKIPLVDIWQTLGKIKLYLLPIAVLILLIFTINQFFGNAIARRGVEVISLTKATQDDSENPSPPPPHQTQLEADGQETAKIRTIVWTGAINIFRHYPILGSGVETFGYSYYLFRPAEHNYTGEWDFLYNKAHNEYLNYLSTTGALGFLSYIIFIVSFELLAIKTIIKSNFTDQRLLSIGLLAGFNANLVQNFFGFSVVTTGILFFSYPAMFFVISNTLGKTFVYELKKHPVFLQKSFYQNLAIVACLILTFLGLASVLSMWAADYIYNRSTSSGTYESSIRNLRVATKLFPGEPKYTSELSSNLAGLAVTLESSDEKTKKYIAEARDLINKAVADHPNDTALWIDKRAIDFNLSKIDESQKLELLRTAEKLKELAPTDASIQYDVALVYLYLEKNSDAIVQLEKVVNLKNDYPEAVLMLARTYIKVKENEKAIKLLQGWLQTNPTDTQSQELLKNLTTS